jgi:hypothetical protein
LDERSLPVEPFPVFDALRFESLLVAPFWFSPAVVLLFDEEELRTRRAMPNPAMTSRRTTMTEIPATTTRLVCPGEDAGASAGVAAGGD